MGLEPPLSSTLLPVAVHGVRVSRTPPPPPPQASRTVALPKQAPEDTTELQEPLCVVLQFFFALLSVRRCGAAVGGPSFRRILVYAVKNWEMIEGNAPQSSRHVSLLAKKQGKMRSRTLVFLEWLPFPGFPDFCMVPPRTWVDLSSSTG